MLDSTLPPEQQRLADEIHQKLLPLFQQEALRVAQLFASKSLPQTLGKTEFELRDRMHELAAASLQSVLDGRKKGGTQDPP